LEELEGFYQKDQFAYAGISRLEKIRGKSGLKRQKWLEEAKVA
jgi:hypothetical protein